MSKSYILLFVLGSFIFSCSKSNSQKDHHRTVEKLIELQQKAIDSNLYVIAFDSDKIIQSLNAVPDTLRIKNDYLIGLYYKNNKTLDSASHYFQKAIALIDSTTILENSFKYFRNAWEADLQLERYSNAKSAADKYINIQNAHKTQIYLEYAYFFIGQMYSILGNDTKESLYYEKALKEAKLSNNENMEGTITLSIAKKIHPKDPQQAYTIINNLIHDKNSNETNRNIYHTYGVLKFFDGDFYEAIDLYKKELSYIKKREGLRYYDYDMNYSYANIAEAYIELKDIKNAEVFLDSAQIYLNSSSDSNQFAFTGKLNMRLDYLKNNDLDKAIVLFDKMMDIQYNAHETKINEELMALQASYAKQRLYAKQRQETELKNLKLQTRNVILLIVASSILIIAYLLYYRRSVKYERQQLYMQQRLLSSQMNPHFTFNILSIIQDHIKRNKQEVTTYLIKFSRLLRLILENSMQNYVILQKEIELLKKYLDLQLLRFPEKFSYRIDFFQLKEDDEIYIPPMLIQPFVENSIEHGFLGIDYKGKINIQFTLEDKLLWCSITDNGAGLKQSIDDLNPSHSIRLISNFLYKTTKSKLKITNTKTALNATKGVEVKFIVPYKSTQND
ncbi:sensor histidine kinase [Winogradskyella sp.]|uniref:sensor histidine kinase n=1 Tax=Winogradskyella sp. TaxID=1883156 RepID=UPI003BA8FAD4